MTLVVVLTFLVFALLGMPLAFALGFASLGALFMADIEFLVLPQRMMHAVDNFPLMAIPLFMLAGELMVEAGIMLVPLFAPIALAYQIDPLFFGFLFVLNLVAGMMTPPVGVLLFVMCGITRISMTQLVRSVWPFVALQYVVLILCLILPDMVTALPRYLGF